MTSDNKDSFSATEVGTLIERFDSKLSIVAEEVRSLSSRMGSVEGRLSSVETRLITVEDVLRVAFVPLEKRVSRIESKLGI